MTDSPNPKYKTRLRPAREGHVTAIFVGKEAPAAIKRILERTEQARREGKLLSSPNRKKTDS
jgi:hypothetical protein